MYSEHVPVATTRSHEPTREGDCVVDVARLASSFEVASVEDVRLQALVDASISTMESAAADGADGADGVIGKLRALLDDANRANRLEDGGTTTTSMIVIVDRPSKRRPGS